jgi:hypothetical protein
MKLFVLALLFSFSLFAFDPTVKLEYEVNENSHQTDILFVIDNSGSMDAHQKTLAEMSDEFLKQFVNVKYKMTAISTDKADPLKNAFITNNSADPIKELASLITSFGTSGDATEQVFGRTNDFLKSETGKDFLRPNTALEIIVITDEEEQSQVTVIDMMSLSSAKKFTFSGLLPVPNPNLCPRYSSPNNGKLEELISRTGGLLLDLCKDQAALSSDYENLAKEIIKRSLHKGVPISKFVFRDPVDMNSIKVYYGTQIIPRGFIGTGWIYDETKNAIIFGGDIILSEQPKGTKFTIQYDIL